MKMNGLSIDDRPVDITHIGELRVDQPVMLVAIQHAYIETRADGTVVFDRGRVTLGPPKTQSADQWWWCKGIQEVWPDKPDDCGDPGSFHPHDKCGPVALLELRTDPA